MSYAAAPQSAAGTFIRVSVRLTRTSARRPESVTASATTRPLRIATQRPRSDPSWSRSCGLSIMLAGKITPLHGVHEEASAATAGPCGDAHHERPLPHAPRRDARMSTSRSPCRRAPGSAGRTCLRAVVRPVRRPWQCSWYEASCGHDERRRLRHQRISGRRSVSGRPRESCRIPRRNVKPPGRSCVPTPPVHAPNGAASRRHPGPAQSLLLGRSGP